MKAAVSRSQPVSAVECFYECDFADKLRYGRAASKAVKAALLFLSADLPCHVEIVFADAKTIAEMNAEHRGKSGSTDVLSFPLLDLTPEEPVSAHVRKEDFISGRLFLGSVVICPEKAFAQAAEYGHGPEREFSFLAVHAALHLLGYDHEGDAAGEAEMEKMQQDILRSIRLTRK